MSPLIELRLRLPLAAFELDLELCSHARALGLFGPSGSGKTSLLEVLAGWRRPAAGHVRLLGRDVFDAAQGLDLPPEQRGVGYVPQDLLLFGGRSVRANVLAGAGRATGGGGVFARAVEVLELGPLLERDVDTLSGGERQRVALARALCSGPGLLLLDEPLASLDLPLRRRVLPYLLRVREEFGVPLVYVSHDATEVAALCDEVCVLHEGRSVDRGAPALVLAGPHGPGASGAELENVLRGEVRALHGANARVALSGSVELEVPRGTLQPGERAVVALCADDVLVATGRPAGLSARNVLPARVVAVSELGAGVLLRAALEGVADPICVELTADAVRELALQPGLPVFLIVKTRACRLLAALPPIPKVVEP